MDITLNNLNNVLDNSSPETLTQIFSKLVDPTQDRIFVVKYTAGIAVRLATKDTKYTGLDAFGKACVSAGFVKTAAELMKLYPPSHPYQQKVYMVQYMVLSSLGHLFVGASTVEQGTVIDQLLSHGVYGFLMQTLNHPLYTIRYITAENIAVTVADPVALEKITTSVTMSVAAGTLVGLCQLALEGADKLVGQLNFPALAWIRGLPWKLGGSIPEDPVDMGRCLAHFQESIMLSACWFLRAYRPLACKDRLEILNANPELLDILFDCAILPRPTLFPTSIVCTLACEILSRLFQLPPYIVLGVSTSIDSTLKTFDWKLLSKGLTILTSRKDWTEKIIEIWMRVEEEDYLKIRTMLERDPPGNSQALSADRSIADVAQHRGLIRVAILRLISTLTHAAESCGMTNTEVESLLRIAYTACRRISPKEECRSSAEHLLHAERTVEDKDVPIATLEGDGPMFIIGSERILGPVALTRLLVVLAQRKALDTIQTLKKPPKGLSSYTSLHHLQQITHPAVIRRFLTIALRRVMELTSEGRSGFTERRYDHAKYLFTSSAELAAALVAFDTHTEGQYSDHIRGARKELVIALSNASATTLRAKEYSETQIFAFNAIGAAENIPTIEGLDRNVVEKCRKRIQEAQHFARDGVHRSARY